VVIRGDGARGGEEDSEIRLQENFKWGEKSGGRVIKKGQDGGTLINERIQRDKDKRGGGIEKDVEGSRWYTERSRGLPGQR